MKRLLLTVALLLVVAVSTAQVTTSAIRGQVTTNDNTPLVGATIVALHTPSGTQYGTITNSEGHFVINGMRVGGPYTVTIAYIGYNSVIYNDLNLLLNSNETLNATLNESSLAVDDVIIVGSAVAKNGTTFRMNNF